jgi:hypothetical protein
MTNKKERFTPGPLHFDGHGINDENGNRISKCCINQWNPDGGLDEKFLAYSLVQAAAPEMLEALQLVVEKLSDRVFKMNVKNSFSEKLAMEAARSAIRKALGE